MDLRTLIHKKRDRLSLSRAEIRDFVEGVVTGAFPDYQISALLMAIVHRGLQFQETVDLTREMAFHGDRLSPPGRAKRVGKHSTGGVGDKTTFLLGPLVASYGVQVPFMSGRSLGHTGGTIDKLSGIVGLNTALSPAKVLHLLKTEGFCIFEQSQNLAPADRRLYALRDASGTVESIPLIVSSILSKKMLESLDGLVLDVKFGGGSFMGPLGRAKKLGKMLLQVAKALKLKATVVYSSMEQPLGQMVGNNLEILECLETLRGQGPQDLADLTVILAREMLAPVLPKTRVPTKLQLMERLTNSELVDPFLHYLGAQGAKMQDKKNLLIAKNALAIRSTRGGWIRDIDAKAIGVASMELGAGRQSLGDSIDPTVGIALMKKRGEAIRRGETLAEVFYRDKKHLKDCRRRIEKAIIMGGQRAQKKPFIAGISKNY
jgi:pyrimidine-nucleoside phosphorylase